MFSGMPYFRMPRRSAIRVDWLLGALVTKHPVKMPDRASKKAVRYRRWRWPFSPSVMMSKVWLSAIHHSLLRISS